MDVLTRLYQSDMRLFPDDPDRITRGAWHWCPEGAEPLPFLHRFASFVWDYDQTAGDPDIGELRGLRGYVRTPSNPRFRGRNFCGGVQLYQHGSPLELLGTPAVDIEGVPLCCRTATPALGGAAAAGTSTFSSSADMAIGLRPEEIAGLVPGAPITSWPATPTTPRAGTGDVPPGTAPIVLVDPSTSWKGGLFTSATEVSTYLTFEVFKPANDFTVYMVARSVDGSYIGPALTSGDGKTQLAVDGDQVLLKLNPATVFTQPITPPAVGTLEVWSIKLEVKVLTLQLGGATIATFVLDAPASIKVDTWAAGLPTSGTSGAWLPEVIVYPKALTTLESAAVYDYLQTKYTPRVQVSTGTAIGDGAATFIVSHIQVSTGTAVGNGSATFHYSSNHQVSTGTAIGDGEATIVSNHQVSTGTAVGNGSATFHYSSNHQVSTGTAVGNGSATFS